MPDFENVRESLIPLVATYGIRVLGALVFLLVAWIAAGWLGSTIAKSLRRAQIDETLSRFLAKFVRWTVLLLAILACLSVFGVQTTSFAAVIGATGLAIGLAFQGTLSNFAAGVMLVVFRPFKVGDVIEAAGESGKVDEISLFTTALDTFDNRRIVIPNSAIFGSTIENKTFHDTRRVDLDIGVDYGSDIDETREILMKCGAEVEGRLEDREPLVVLVGLGDSSVDWSVRVWTKTEDYWDVRERLIESIKKTLDEKKIGIPFPKLDIHLEQSSPS